MRIKTETLVGIFILVSISAFFYLTLHVGALRFDKEKYFPYGAYFKDVSGLTKKADVKIAGVKVGWVESLSLENTGLVKTNIMILKNHELHSGGYAVLRQESLLGSKFIEIVPGDSRAPLLVPGAILGQPDSQPANVDDLLTSFKQISQNIQEVSGSLKDTFATSEGALQLKQALDSFTQAASSIATMSSHLEHLVARNENSIHETVSDLKGLLEELKERLPLISHNIAGVTEKLNEDILPQVSDSLVQLSSTLQGDFLPQLQNTTNALVSNFGEATDSIKDMANTIRKGEGIVGKLLNDGDLCRNVQDTIASVRSTFTKLDKLGIVIDGHVESMQGPACGAAFEDAKGYFNLRVHPTEDFFYLLGFTFSQKGYITRTVLKNTYFDENCNELLPSRLVALGNALVGQQNISKIERDSFRLNLQFGKIYHDIALRIGLFEGTFGGAIDYDIPFADPRYKWVMSFQAYDFNGRNRFEEGVCQSCEGCEGYRLYKPYLRPHLRWLNKLFVTPNFYFAFGADDFVSRNNKNAFFGVGLRFADDDLKYLVTSLPT